MELKWSHTIYTIRSDDIHAMMRLIKKHTDINADTVKWIHPLSDSAKSNPYDYPTWYIAMNGQHKEGYFLA